MSLQGISEHVFYGHLVYKFKRIVVGLILVINLKRLLNVINERDATCIHVSCDSLYAWL